MYSRQFSWRYALVAETHLSLFYWTEAKKRNCKKVSSLMEIISVFEWSYA